MLIIKVLFIMPAMLAVLSLSAQTADNQNISIVKNIEYNVSMCNFQKSGFSPNFASRTWFRDNIECSDRLAFVDMLVEKIMSGTLKLSDTLGNLLNQDQINAVLYRFDTVRLARVMPPYDLFDTIISVPQMDPDKIMNLRFREEWSYNPGDMSFQKIVLAMAPLITEYDYDFEIGRDVYTTGRPLFWIVFGDNNEKAFMQPLTQRIMYGVDYKGDPGSRTSFSDSAAIDAYFIELAQRILEGKINGYSHNDAALADQPVDAASFTENLDLAGSHAENITNFRFLEEWSFDTNTMAITKKVVGVCPVIKVLEDDNEFRGWRVLYWSYFQPVWMPYGKTLPLKN